MTTTLLVGAAALAVGLSAGAWWAARRGRTGPPPLGAATDLFPTNTWEWRVDTDALAVTPRLLETLDMTRQEFGETVTQFLRLVHPEDRGRVTAYVDRFRRGEVGDQLFLEYRMGRTPDTARWYDVQGTVVDRDGSRPSRVLGIFIDVNDRVEAAEERDRLFNLSPDLLAIGNFEGYLEQVNPAWVRVLGWARDDLMAEPLTEFIHPEDRDATEEAQSRLVLGESVEGLESRFRCRDGSYRWLSWSSFPYADRRRVFSVVRDVSRRKTVENDLQEHQARLEEMRKQVARAEDRQRRQLADALHDGLAQQLFGIRAQLSVLRRTVADPAAGARLEDITTIVDEALRDTRNLSFELFPPVLYEVGLVPALEELARRFAERSGMACRVEADLGRNPELAEDLRAMIYQSVRELLVNAARHGGARRARIMVAEAAGEMLVTVEDDGRGFGGGEPSGSDPQATGGYGLFSIRERLRGVDGRLDMGPAPAGGARITIALPVVPPADGGPRG